MRVEWVAPKPSNYGHGTHPDAVGFRIDVISVDSADRRATRAALQTIALPYLHEWITNVLSADETWRQTPHLHHWRFVNGLLTRDQW